MKNKKKNEFIIKYLIQLVFWLGIWELISLLVASPVLVPSPVRVLKRASELVFDVFFWQLFLNAFTHVFLGLIIGLALGLVLGLLAYYNKQVKWIVDPFIDFIKTTPVAALIIILLLWFSAKSISTILVVLVIFPNIYLNILAELRDVDSDIVELMEVYKVGHGSRFRYVYLPLAMNSIYKNLSFALGFGWKSGISGEIMAQVKNTYGNQIYLSKIYLETDSLLAYVILLILLSTLIEKLILLIIDRAINHD